MAWRKCLLVLCCASLGIGGSETRAQERSLSDLAFMSGCWRGKLAGQNGTIEERYNPAAGGVMLGTSQVVVDGRTAFFEFIKVEQTDGGVVMTPAPRGKLSVPFKLVHLDGKKAVFENPAHDFPKRIAYELRESGSLVARIEGDKPEQREEFVMEPIPCGTANLANFWLKWGDPGHGVGQYQNPTAIALFEDAFGVPTLLFADTNNHRVRSYTWNGMFIDKWGEEGEGPGQFRYPQGIAVTNRGEVVIADSGNHRIQVTTGSAEELRGLPGQLRFTFGRRGAGPGELQEPAGVAVDQDDNIYVADAGNHRVQKFDAQGRFLAAWGGPGREPGRFDRPMGLAIDRARGWLYVTDTDNGRVHKLDLDGRFLLTWGEPGTRTGQLYRPKGIAVDPLGDVWVVDSNNHRLTKYTPEGVVLGSFGRNGMGDGELWFPFGVAVDGKGRLFVTDSENGRIQVFRENPQVARLSAASPR